MPNTTVDLVAGQWTQITVSNVTSARIQNVSGFNVWIQAAVDPATPAAGEAGKLGALLLPPYDGYDASFVLANFFPGIAGANRLWAYVSAPIDKAGVSVSYA